MVFDLQVLFWRVEHKFNLWYFQSFVVFVIQVNENKTGDESENSSPKRAKLDEVGF